MRHADWKEAEFFDELPAHLRGDVAAFLMDEVFEQSDFFRCLLDILSLSFIVTVTYITGILCLFWHANTVICSFALL